MGTNLLDVGGLSDERYRGRLATLVPALVLALPLALGGFVGLLMATAGGRIQVPGYNERVALLFGSIFCGFCAVTLLKVALAGFYLEVTLNQEAVVLRQLRRSRWVGWEELKRVVCLPTVLCLMLKTGEQIDVSPSLVGFERLQESVQSRFEASKQRGQAAAPAPATTGDWTTLA